jgi:hypothetical protein
LLRLREPCLSALVNAPVERAGRARQSPFAALRADRPLPAEEPYKLKPIHCLPALFFAIAAISRAQISAELEGTVHDPSGKAIANAQVALIDGATNLRQQTFSSRSGDFHFAHLNPGTYSIDVTAAGFERLIRAGITATVGQTVTTDLVLTVGSDRQTVEVTADAPLMQAAESDIETHVNGMAVVSLPLNSRNFINLAQLAPGVALPPGTVLPRINGGRPRTNEYLFDGISALQPEPGQVAFFPMVDNIQEFTVEADNVPAEFGRFNGGVVNIATRSGSNQFHGSLFEFFRNEDLNARNYFASTGRKPEYRRNLYGATLGGPILPNRLFFFSDYQGIKALIGRTVISTIPTMNERQGIFTGVSKIYDPDQTTVVGGKYIRPEFANDVITEPLDPAALALMARFPTPTTTAAANNYTRTANDADHQNQFDARIDGAYRTRDRAFGRYSYFSDVEQPVTPLPGGSGAISGTAIGTGGVSGLSNVLGQQAVLDEVHDFSPRLINDVHAGYTRRGNTINGPVLGNTASRSLNIPGIPTNAAFNNALPLFTFTGFQQLGPSASTFSHYQTGVWQLEEMLTYIRGRHTLKAGGDLRFYQLNAVAPPNPTGSFAFTTTGTDTQTATGTTTTGGNSLASFLLGQVDTFSIDLQQSTIRPRDHIQEYFAQDNWRITDRLTFNLGTRWTLHSPSTEKNNQGAVFNTATQLLDYAGVNGNSRSARQLHWNNVAPRVGLTWLMTPRTVVRSGFGIVFIDQSGITTPFTLPQYPFIQNVLQKTQDSINSAFTLSNGPTVTAIPLNQNAGLGQSVYTAVRTAGSGYVEQWNLGFQRQILSNLSIDFAYVGSRIVRVGIPDSNFNQLTQAQLAQGVTNPTSLTGQVANPCYGQVPSSSSIGGKTVAAAQLLKPYECFQNVAIYRHNSGQSNYNAFEAKAEQRLAHGLYFLVAYTHSRLIDDASSVFSTTVLSSPNSSSLIAADAFTPRLERDVSSGDMSNVTSVSTVYNLPAGSGHRFGSTHFADDFLGGWSLNAIGLLQSGMPVTITQATNNNSFAGYSLQRPNLVAQPALAPSLRTPSKYFNTAAFSAAGQFVIGTASRNPVRGPAYRDLDFALVKRTHLAEKTDAEFRAEIFNITNTPAFSQPNGSFGSAAFGSITSTTTEQRVAQFALRIVR